jgi:hypothetical protein
MPRRSHQTAKRRVAFMYALRGVVVVDLGSEEFEDALGGFGRRGRGREKHGGGRGGMISAPVMRPRIEVMSYRHNFSNLAGLAAVYLTVC